MPQCTIQNSNLRISALCIVGNGTGALWHLWVWSIHAINSVYSILVYGEKKKDIIHELSARVTFSALLVLITIFRHNIL